MIFDLLSTDMYAQYNVKVAQALGLNAAVYINELININRKAIEKKKLTTEDGKFLVKRSYIKDRTTLTEDEQLILDNKFIKLEIMKKDLDKPDELCLDIDNLTSLLLAEDKDILKEAGKTIKKRGRPAGSTREIQAATLKKFTESHRNPEIVNALKGWVDGVYANPKGFLSKIAIETFMKELDDYCNCDLDLALKLIEIATINGYRVFEWAKKQFENNYKKDWDKQHRVVQSTPTSNNNQTPLEIAIQKPRRIISREEF